MSNQLAEILDAMRAHHHARAAAPDERARQRVTDAFWQAQTARQRCLAERFGALNGWRLTQREFLPEDIGTCRHHWEGLPDHPLFYRDPRTRRNAALVAQPYVMSGADGNYTVDGRGDYQHWRDYIVALQADYAARGLRCHTPPHALASFHYPGATLFLVITKPDVTVRWLPEQLAWQPEPRAAGPLRLQ